MQNDDAHIEPLNILLFDFIPEKKGSLLKALQDASFNVKFAAPEQKEEALRQMPSLILFRLASRAAYDEYDDILRELQKRHDIPVVMLTSDHNPDFYYRGIEYGICDYIMLPCSVSFLVSKIEGIARNSPPRRISEAVHADSAIVLNSGDQTLHIHRDAFMQFFFSFVDNSIHQNSLLQNLLRHRPAFKGLSGDIDVIHAAEIKFADAEELEYDVLHALNNEEFEMFYQPIKNLGDNKVCGLEALIRWNHPRKGLLMPESFIPAVEETPMVSALGYWVVENVVKQIKLWNVHISIPFRVSINLSARQFVSSDLAEKIIDIVESHGVSPDQMGLEITESAFMEDMEMANMNLLKLKAKHFSVYMDDFGTGYSSLSYLLHFPVDVIKIDKSFVQWMHIDEGSEEIVRSVITLAHNLNRTVIAEGVEVPEHLAKLKLLKCDYIQGYLISVPINSIDTIQYLKENCTVQ